MIGDEFLRDKKKYRGRLMVLLLVLAVSFVFSLMAGRYGIALPELVSAFLGKSTDPTIQQVLFQVRIPRVLAAMIIGGSLSVSGAAYQGMFKNPLVSPDLLGASAGAGFGAAAAMLLSLGIMEVKLISFAFGLAAVFLTWFISTKLAKGDDSYFLLILGGILVSTVFQSLLSAVKYLADPQDQLPAINFWLMGSLSKVDDQAVIALAIPFAVGIVILFSLSFKLNVLSFGEEEAKAMGINTTALQMVVIVTATVLTTSSVSLCGMIGWVGLVIPHLARMLVGPNFRYLIPASTLLGSIYLLIVDDLARSALQVEIPLGILTSLIGVPFFIYLLMQRKRGW